MPGCPRSSSGQASRTLLRQVSQVPSFVNPSTAVDYVLPVGSETVMPVLGYRSIVDGILKLHEVSSNALGHDRAVSLPALTITVADMMAALHRVAGDRNLGAITIAPDPFIEAICRGWPLDTNFQRALDLGLPVDGSLDDIVRHYIEDYVDSR